MLEKLNVMVSDSELCNSLIDGVLNMDISEMVINFFGKPGSGKTTNAGKLFIDHASENGVKTPEILVLDMDKDHRARKNIKTHFNGKIGETTKFGYLMHSDVLGYTDTTFEVIELLQRVKKEEAVYERQRKSNLFNDLPGNEYKIDYYGTYKVLAEILGNLDEILDGKKYALIDGYFPTIRKKIGLAKFFHDNPTRKNAVKEDYTDINPIESQVYDTLANACQDRGICVVFTGKMEVAYETGAPEFSSHDIEIPHSASLTLELVSPEITKAHKKPAITVNCHKSTRSFTWTDEIRLEDSKAEKEEDRAGRSLYKILYGRYEID